MKPIFCKHHLDFTKRDLAIVVAQTLQKGEKHIAKKLGLALNLSTEDHCSKALCVTMDNGAIVLLFTYKHLAASLVCHEVTHATNGIFDHIGIKLNQGSDEAFAYHNDMLFRKVVELLNEHKVTLPLIPC